MVENRSWLTVLAHGIVLLGIAIMVFPIYVTFVASTSEMRDIVQPPLPLVPGPYLIDNYVEALQRGVSVAAGPPVALMLWNSLVMALAIAVGKIAISLLSAFAIVYFRFPFRMVFFWTIFITLMLPVEVRILPTFKVVADLGMLNNYAGLTIPLIASATATFLFRQFFLTIPDELLEASRIDGAGPIARFFDVTLPQLRDVLLVIVLLRAIWDFKEFDLIFLLTGGGPVISTQTLSLLVYKEAFSLNQMGMAAAHAVVMMALMLAFMLLYLRRSKAGEGG